jgi:syntaxin 1B/2/3
LSAVRARHDELQRIEQTIVELAAMFNDMDQLVVAQEPAVERTEESAEQAQEDVSKGNVEVGKAIKHARNRNKLKWYCLLIVVLIVLGIALGVGLGVGLSKTATSKTKL